MVSVAVRRHVPNDHSCLFWAVAYLTEGGESSRSKARELREICAQDALQDPDQATRGLLLGQSVEEYATWIRNDFHWGGENEVIVLSKHYNVEIAIVSCESLKILCYGSDNPSCKGRIYLLYTGQHYDPIVAGPDASVSVADEQKVFPKGNTSIEQSALERAREHNVETAKKAKQRRGKKIKCLGCGALLSDSEAFATHCSEVEHGDDFAYDCEEVEVVIEGDEALPEGMLDLNSDSVHTFVNNAKEPLSHSYPAPVTINGVTYPTLEHFWQSARFQGQDDDLAKLVATAPTADEAGMMANGALPSSERPDWRERRWEVLLLGLRAKGAQSATVAAVLASTGQKTIVSLGQDPWGCMQAPGGIPTGQNNIGKALMQVRSELQAGQPASGAP